MSNANKLLLYYIFKTEKLNKVALRLFIQPFNTSSPKLLLYKILCHVGLCQAKIKIRSTIVQRSLNSAYIIENFV